MTMITPSYLGETIEYSSLHACRSTLEDPTPPKDRKEAHMILKPGESRVNGNAGCNNFFGGYEVDGESLGFGQMGATMMACLDGMETEQAFLAALGNTDRYTISGLILSLYSGENLLAKFEAIHLP